MELTEVQHDVESRARDLPARLVDRLAERIGGAASTSSVFGTPVEREGVTVVPVAKLRWGFGAGGGSGTANGDEAGSGGGGGGGVMATPMGYIEIANGHAEFHPIKTGTPGLAIAPVVIASGVAAWLALSGLRRLLRG